MQIKYMSMNTAIRFLIIGFVFAIIVSPNEMKSQCGMTVDITANPGTPANLCPGQTITLTSIVTGGTAPYSYLWGDGSITQNLTITPPFYGEVYLMVTDATGCIAFGQIHIKAWVWTVEIVYNPTSVCLGDSIALSAWPAFPAGTTFLWSTGETTDQIFVLASGTYSLTVTDPTIGCSASTTQSVFISYWPTIDPIITGPTVLCTGQNATLIAQENPGYFFLWNTGEETTSIDISSPGIYSVTVSNFAGCFGTDSFEVLPGTAPPLISAPSVLCNGQNGTISVTNPGSYTNFQWNTGANSSSIIINTAGTYTVTVTANGGCTATGSVIVTAGSSNINLMGTPTPMTSCTNPNGSINLTVTPSGSYSFLWSNGSSIEDISGLTAGSYTVTVTDAGGCTSSSSYTVTSNVTIPTPSTNFTAASCNQNNGAVDLSVTPAGTYTFLWSNGVNTEDLSNIFAGTYSVTVTSTSTGCTATTSVSVPNNSSPPLPVATSIADTCGQGTGAVDLSVTQSGTYTFLWSNGATTEDLSNLMAGTYSVTVTSSANGCTSTAIVTVPNFINIINITGNSTPLTSCTSSNGAIDITPAPSGVYTFVWSTGETTEDLTNLSIGNYTVTVSSSAGCTAIATYSVVNNTTSPVPVATPSPATCGQSNGAIDINVTPTGTYTYVWSNGSITEDLISIPAGNYSVTVTSTDGCTSITSITVQDNLIPLTITGTTFPNTSCNNQNGSIDISVNPSGTYTYAWSNGATTEDLNTVQAGVYNVTVTFGLTCINTQSFEVFNTITPIAFTGITTPNTSCSLPNGAIDITISTPGSFTYLWSNGEITEDLQDLTGGTYSLTVTGSNGCTATELFDIINTNSNFSFIGSVLPNTSCALPNGSIDLTLTPSGSYSFIWSNGASSEDLQNLSAGNYSVTVSDINNCALVESYSIQDILSYPVISSLVTPSSCGNNNGAIDISIMPANGNSFSWSNGSTTEDQLNLLTGDYIVTVTGINGCITIDTIDVGNQNSNFTLTAVTIPNSSCIINNGSIDLSITPSGTYTYAWNNGAMTQDLQGIATGSFIVTVTDILNCISSDTFLVADNISIPILSANITSANCGANNGGIDLTVNPTANNTFLWSNGSVAEDLPNIFPGSYSVIVTDTTNGCQVLDTFNVQNINNNFSISGSTVSNTSCTSQTGSIDLTIAPAGTYTFIWSNGFTSEDLSALNPGSYTVTVTDNASCSSSAVFIVDNNTPIITISASVTPSTCGSNNGAIDLTINPSVGNSFLWSNGAITEDLQNILSGSYSLTVTGSNGCITSDTVFVPDVGSAISLSAFPAANTNCVLQNGSIDLSVSPPGTYTYSWSNGFSTEDQNNLSPGIYIVTVADSNGCSSIGTFMIDNQTVFLPSMKTFCLPRVDKVMDKLILASALRVIIHSSGLMEKRRKIFKIFIRERIWLPSRVTMAAVQAQCFWFKIQIPISPFRHRLQIIHPVLHQMVRST
ncbi:MAG: hypothetical protein IPP15_21445 [Saprospiraceae bacterium]|uniref:Ig-like domain-containing protein n=1 Tax=Candidatus Opimibacter skivensis TaxID=2982028 RepID=A0A9D7SZN2_9BACT|nr:hypothetical protein [Candidatus Opimibacter skivensis]